MDNKENITDITSFLHIEYFSCFYKPNDPFEKRVRIKVLSKRYNYRYIKLFESDIDPNFWFQIPSENSPFIDFYIGLKRRVLLEEPEKIEYSKNFEKKLTPENRLLLEVYDG